MLVTRERDKSAEEDEKDRLKRRDSKKHSHRETQRNSDRDMEKEGRRHERRDSERSVRSTRDAERERAKDLERRESGKSRATDKDKPRDKKDKDAAAYGPEFLRAFAKANSVSSGRDSQFEVITGEDAVRFTRRFVREHADADAAILPPGALATAKSTDSHASKGKARSLALDTATASDKLKQSNSARRILPPVVFALPRSAAGDASRKVVDFYMSWRGKTVCLVFFVSSFLFFFCLRSLLAPLVFPSMKESSLARRFVFFSPGEETIPNFILRLHSKTHH
ncbi:hypothetical protein B0H11DRAFT_571966 [Mycena galericulata]|nr:hypothetical protein B0H11DRAFT_571966 [Mycena galericulata]